MTAHNPAAFPRQRETPKDEPLAADISLGEDIYETEDPALKTVIDLHGEDIYENGQ